ncbi:MAG: cob(I)yrinic acid a,c-diamide adenosyltransferase [Anaeromyxobacter sp.]
MTTGIVAVYTGDGKGKTTAALGLVFRALGRGLSVAVVQFVKGRWKTGERLLAARLEAAALAPARLTFRTLGQGFTWEGADPGVHAQAARAAWAEARALLAAGDHRIVVLDELTHAVNRGFVALEELLETLAARPPATTVVVTGRDAPPALCQAADLVTEMRAVKHPFTSGVKAIAGVDY